MYSKGAVEGTHRRGIAHTSSHARTCHQEPPWHTYSAVMTDTFCNGSEVPRLGQGATGKSNLWLQTPSDCEPSASHRYPPLTNQAGASLTSNHLLCSTDFDVHWRAPAPRSNHSLHQETILQGPRSTALQQRSRNTNRQAPGGAQGARAGVQCTYGDVELAATTDKRVCPH
jgi:hypothetical protein